MSSVDHTSRPRSTFAAKSACRSALKRTQQVDATVLLIGALLIVTSGKDQIRVESRPRTLAFHRPAVQWRGLDIVPLTASSAPTASRGGGVLALANFTLR